MQIINSPRQTKKLAQRFLIGIVASSAGAFVALPGTAMPEAGETTMTEATEVPVEATEALP